MTAHSPEQPANLDFLDPESRETITRVARKAGQSLLNNISHTASASGMRDIKSYQISFLNQLDKLTEAMRKGETPVSKSANLSATLLLGSEGMRHREAIRQLAHSELAQLIALERQRLEVTL